MRCRDIMISDVECVSKDTRAKDAACRMRDEDIGFLPVCEASGRAVGALTDRDLAIRLVAEGRPLDCKVGDLLTREVVACRPDDDVRDAERLMRQHKKQRLMVIDDDGRLVGVISLHDLAQSEDEEEVGATVRSVKSDAQATVH